MSGGSRRSSLDGSIFDSQWGHAVKNGEPQNADAWDDWGDPWAEAALDMAEVEMRKVLDDAAARGLTKAEIDTAMAAAAARIKSEVEEKADAAVPAKLPRQPWVDKAIDAVVAMRGKGYDGDRLRRDAVMAADVAALGADDDDPVFIMGEDD